MIGPEAPVAAAPGSEGQRSSTGTVNVAGAEIFVREQGYGEPILFLHGNPDSSDLWLETWTMLEGPFRCLAPDLPGFGRSGFPPDLHGGFDFRLPSLARFLDEFLRAKGVDGRVRLVVHDFGGPYGLAWAVENPRRVAAVVVVNSFFTTQLRWHPWARIWRTPFLGEASMKLMNRRLFRREMRRGSPSLTDPYLDSVYAHSTPALRRRVLALYRATDPEVFKGWEARWLALAETLPVKVLWGTKDPYLLPFLAESFGSDDIELFPEVGHWLPVEAPALFANRLSRFFLRP